MKSRMFNLFSLLVVCLLLAVAVLSGTAHAAEPAVAVMTDASTGFDFVAILVEYWDLISSIVGTAAIIAALTKTQRDDTIVGIIVRFIDFLGANFVNAKNANAKKPDNVL